MLSQPLRSSPTAPTEAPPAAPGKSRPWLWFVIAFALQAAAWIAWLTIAAHHRVQEVPIATQSAP